MAKIAWLERVELPREFRLDSMRTVVDAELFRHALLVEAAKGPTGPRARRGVLQADINRLQELFKDAPLKSDSKVEVLDDDLEVEVIDRVGG